jgi:hypothetical protein
MHDAERCASGDDVSMASDFLGDVRGSAER